MNPLIRSDASPSPRGARLDLVWRALRQPLLLLAVAILLLLFVLAGWFLPQLPGQYANLPTEAARWLLATQEAYGALGPLLAGLGLFDLAHSLALRLLLILLIFLLLIHLGDALVGIQRLRRLPSLLSLSLALGEALPVPGTLPLYRWRGVVPVSPASAAEVVEHWLAQASRGRRNAVQRERQAVAAPGAAGEGEQPEPLEEQRWLLTQWAWALPLRLLFLLGVLLALAVAWSGLAFGWQIDVPALAPGAQVRFPDRRLLLSYQLPPNPEGEGRAPALLVNVDGATQTLPVEAAQRARLGGVMIFAEASGAALLVEGWDAGRDEPFPALALPGRPQTAQLSFVFPGVGSEESVLIPDAGVGLRIVRLSDDPTFLVEVIGSDAAEPLERRRIRGEDRITLSLGDETLTVRFRFLPSLRVRAQHWPGIRLLWGALALGIVGALGFVRRPHFVLVQLAPWPPENRALLLVQSDRAQPTEVLPQRLLGDEAGSKAPESQPAEGDGDGAT